VSAACSPAYALQACCVKYTAHLYLLGMKTCDCSFKSRYS